MAKARVSSSPYVDLQVTTNALDLSASIGVALEKADKAFIANFAFVIERWRSKYFNANLASAIRGATHTRTSQLSDMMQLVPDGSPAISGSTANFKFKATSGNEVVDRYGATQETGRKGGGPKQAKYYMVPLASWLRISGDKFKDRTSIFTDLQLPRVFWLKDRNPALVFQKKPGKWKRTDGLMKTSNLMYLGFDRTTGVYGDVPSGDREGSSRKPLAAIGGAVAAQFRLGNMKQTAPAWFSRALARQDYGLPVLYNAINSAVTQGGAISASRAKESGDLVAQFTGLAQVLGKQILP
jgi:hypothetical protein